MSNDTNSDPSNSDLPSSETSNSESPSDAPVDSSSSDAPVDSFSSDAPVDSPPPAWKSALGYLGAFILGAVLLVAAWAKALDPSAFATQIEGEGLAFLLSAETVALIALALEVFLGAALLLNIRRLWILLPSAALVIFFLFLTGRKYWRYMQGIEPDDAGCGCFGNLVERTPAEAFWQDMLLMVPALLLAFLGRPILKKISGFSLGERLSSPDFPRLRTALTIFLTIAATVFAWKAPDLPLDDLATRLKPDVEILKVCFGKEDEEVCFDDSVPELAEGEHLVVLTELTEEAFSAQVPQLNEYTLEGAGPTLWIVTGASEDVLFTFNFSYGPAFEIREAPSALLRPLYRTLPRSFRVRDGVVTETWSGLPALPPSE